MRSNNEYPPPPPPPITVLIHIQSATPIEKHNRRGGGIHKVIFLGGPKLKSKSIGSTPGASQRQRNEGEEG